MDLHKNYMRRFCGYILILTGLTLVWPSSALAKEESLRMGVFPRRDAARTIHMYTSLTRYLSHKLGRKVLLETEKLTYLAKGQQLARLPWAVNKRLPKKLRASIRMALTTLKKTSEGKKILRTAHLTNIVTANDREYNRHRKIIRIVTGKNY